MEPWDLGATCGGGERERERGRAWVGEIVGE